MSVAEKKSIRLRDPIHGLITFREKSDLDGADSVAWELIGSPEFQRLRRIRQLGFSEFTYPGATHNRFAHSIGVYHNARSLLKKIKGLIGNRKYNTDRARIAACAALLHDIGHGPFSHTFEDVQKKLGRKKRHEQWTAQIICESESVAAILKKSGIAPEDISKLIEADEPEDIYSSIVSSQFDADRLDYLVRDRVFSGVNVGNFDIEWLLDCIEVHEVFLSYDESKAAAGKTPKSRKPRIKQKRIRCSSKLHTSSLSTLRNCIFA
jgi:HD superfamily phosphohydrolase